MPYRIKHFVAWLIRSAVLWSANFLSRHKVLQAKNIHVSVVLGGETSITGNLDNLSIGELTYINFAQIEVGDNSRVQIGSGCAIGYRVSIKARTHSLMKPTSNLDGEIVYKEADIVIGDNVWIGDGVYVREGVSIGNNVVIGANSVVTKSFPDNVIIAGVPAVVIKAGASAL